MYKFYLPNLGVTVSLEVEDPNASAEMKFEGEKPQVRLTRAELHGAYGAFGHTIDTWATPIDLHCALVTAAQSDRRFEFEMTEGQIDSYDPGIPPDAIT
ncbi:hypothetical protein H6G20_23180 [Desertifilum sp. FACHB-1129]|uniref:Uncharacterized protein n=2 Tax=Desertifilum tharense IPPAS B-1220 TaxID=1781255 RepID=A0A1E5QQ16_9CYAN|nr:MULTISPECIES: hypothetical protein [Desertifilum]MDA0212601.1 hypothetical protein [Cyanobacteria bacterium FC1]MBD2314576.1 hypothetical protein [Desertifilum sp. FACHB-1129]MBD2321747.1 hypothetical protein [Desertifilum sp. FACHB-866]MBD2331874.1 hypothetical protein [Desertifilum sp. FACHB-868]OEJ76765.1 hypothetical protein BH720_03120 [Desertifilum tharense IPPAS B-1220]